MNVLLIDSHDFIHIALFSDKELIKEKYVLNQKNNSTVLLNTIIDVIGDNCYDLIAVINGPGSFTGTRLGVCIAKTIAYTKDIPIKSLSYLDYLNIMLDSQDHIVGVKDNKGMFIGKYSNNKLIDNYKYITEYQNSNIITDVTFNFNKLFNYLKTIKEENPHYVNPIYVKKIDALK